MVHGSLLQPAILADHTHLAVHGSRPQPAILADHTHLVVHGSLLVLGIHLAKLLAQPELLAQLAILDQLEHLQLLPFLLLPIAGSKHNTLHTPILESP